MLCATVRRCRGPADAPARRRRPPADAAVDGDGERLHLAEDHLVLAEGLHLSSTACWIGRRVNAVEGPGGGRGGVEEDRARPRAPTSGVIDGYKKFRVGVCFRSRAPFGEDESRYKYP